MARTSIDLVEGFLQICLCLCNYLKTTRRALDVNRKSVMNRQGEREWERQSHPYTILLFKEEQRCPCCQKGKGGDGWNKWRELKGASHQVYNKYSCGYIIYSLRNMIKNIALSLYGDRWSLNLSWWSFYSVHKFQIIM